jgi:hypothetical protein
LAKQVERVEQILEPDVVRGHALRDLDAVILKNPGRRPGAMAR